MCMQAWANAPFQGPDASVTSIWQPQLTTDCSQSLALSLSFLLYQKEILPTQRLLRGLTKIRFNKVLDTTSDTVLNHSLSFQKSSAQFGGQLAHEGSPRLTQENQRPWKKLWFLPLSAAFLSVYTQPWELPEIGLWDAKQKLVEKWKDQRSASRRRKQNESHREAAWRESGSECQELEQAWWWKGMRRFEPLNGLNSSPKNSFNNWPDCTLKSERKSRWIH